MMVKRAKRLQKVKLQRKKKHLRKKSLKS